MANNKLLRIGRNYWTAAAITITIILILILILILSINAALLFLSGIY